MSIMDGAPQAESDIASLGVNNINGIQESSSHFWRVKNKTAPQLSIYINRKYIENCWDKRL
ncbi:MAG: hypothetical protein V8R51_06065 [Clostridia bacterium]